DLFLVCALICESDRRNMIIPDALVALLFLIAVTAPFTPGRFNQALGAAFLGALFLMVRETYYLWKQKHGLGLGDVKLAAAMGARRGPSSALLAIGVAAGVTAAFIIISKRQARELEVAPPFGVGLSASLALPVLLQSHA